MIQQTGQERRSDLCSAHPALRTHRHSHTRRGRRTRATTTYIESNRPVGYSAARATARPATASRRTLERMLFVTRNCAERTRGIAHAT